MVNLEDFEVGAPLGEGSFGTVSRCMLREDGSLYAIKEIVKASVKKQKHGQRQMMTERNVLLRLKPHPSIIQLHFTFRDEAHYYFVLELAQGGELSAAIEKLGALNVDVSRWLMAELLEAISYMHSRHVVHRDLKPQNILLDQAGHVKLIDFGSARDLDSNEELLAFVGTAEYVSPEVLLGDDASEASDYWALGCILFCMLTGAPPFVGETQYFTFERIKARDFSTPELLEALPESARALVLELLTLSPAERLGGGAGADVK